MADKPQRPQDLVRQEFCYFVSGHAFVKSPNQPIGSEAQPININTVIRMDEAITDDAGIDTLTGIVRQHLATEAESMDLILVDWPTIRQVNLLHTLMMDRETGDLLGVD